MLKVRPRQLFKDQVGLFWLRNTPVIGIVENPLFPVVNLNLASNAVLISFLLGATEVTSRHLWLAVGYVQKGRTRPGSRSKRKHPVVP